MKRDQFVSICFIALLVFVVYQVFLIFSPFFKAIFWSAILAFGFYPIYAKLKSTSRMHEPTAAALMTAIIVLIVVPPLVFLVINIAAQAIELYQTASDYVRSGSLERLIEDIRSFHYIQNIEERIVQWEPLKKNLSEWLLTSARNIGNFTAAQVGTVSKNLLFVLLNLIFMVFLLFVFLLDGEKIYEFVYQITPLEEKNKSAIFERINETFSAVIRGQILTAVTQGAVAGTVFWILGLPVAIFFGILTFLTSLIPVAGAATVWFPLVVYLFFKVQYVKMFILLACGIGISLIDNFMKPALIGEKTKLPYFLLCFGILGGLKVYGLIGIFLAPVILSLFFALVKIYQEKNW